MTQPVRIQARVPLLALFVLALATLAGTSLGRVTSGATARPEATLPAVMATELVSAQRPVVQAPADKTSCGSGTYISGDLAGDRSPAEIYASMCGKP